MGSQVSNSNEVPGAHAAFCGGGARPSDLLSAAQWRWVTTSLRLSVRELEIVRLVFDDETEGAIASTLGMSVHTVHTHLERLYRKLGVGSRGALLVRVFAEELAHERSTYPAGPAPRQA